MTGKIRLFILIMLIGVMSCLDSPGNLVIARFNNGLLLLKETINQYNNLSIAEKEGLTNVDAYYRFVRKVALEKIILDKAYAQGLDKEKAIAEKIDKTRKNCAFEILKKKNVTDKIVLSINDFNRYKKRYVLYQIVKRTDIPDQNKIQQNKALMEKLSHEIKTLDNFIESAKKYSDDITSVDGGYIGDIRAGVMEDKIDQVIEKLSVGKVSAPVESSTGIHLFFIKEINEANEDDLIKDEELREQIISDKRLKLEEEWYSNLLKDSQFVFYPESIKEKKYDNAPVVKYLDKTIDRNEFFMTVDNYRQNIFPEPTYDEMVRLAKNMGLNLIIEHLGTTNSVINSAEYRDRLNQEIRYILLDEFIKKNKAAPVVTDEAIRQFYQDNLKTLFTFKLDNGTTYIQPMNEVVSFITEKLEGAADQETRYELYRKLVKEENLVIDEKILKDFKKYIK